MSTHYEILGVEETADLPTIRKAFCRIQLENHPDKTQSLPIYERERRENISKAANEAWKILSDEKAKDEYDASLQWFRPADQSGEDVSQTKAHRKAKYSKRHGWYETAQPPPPPPTNFTAYAHWDNGTEPGYDPDFLSYSNNGWSFEMRTSPRCRSVETWEADANRVWEHANGVVIKTRLGKVKLYPGQDDITITVHSTPNHQKVCEIRSCFQQTVTDDGKETVLYVSILTSPTAHGDTLPKWKFAWNVIPARVIMHVPREAQHWAVYLTFHTKVPSLEEGPMQYLVQFDVLQPMVPVDLGTIAFQKLSYGYGADMHHVYRLAAAAYKVMECA
ncbi:DnaJ-domain-containing protein [Lophiostoma macrostomum CBS 122681]|uniref:DnaJ-domain-containing protein n=1 Tax=Lophiostoma macrostomum CBS 122681 TaxID=1314788 RepID=A0A6A6TSF6_9PLEO|nr:DnaJ-domain-containing protein [Lophiostoma macrostomum CBS 122681]